MNAVRQLTDLEIKQIRCSIAKKEILSAELLMELDDHYSSHLEGFSEGEFENQLMKLDEKFTPYFCKGLQYKLNKNAKEEILKSQWKVIQGYFCASKWLYLVGFSAVIIFISSQIRTELEIKILLFMPLLLLTLSNIVFHYQNFQKLRQIKTIFQGFELAIYSSFARPLSERLFLPFLLIQSLVFLPKIIFPGISIENNYLAASASIMSILLALYTLSLLEVWRLKSKIVLV